jgi:excisionase family DNA binding protein
VPKNEQLIPTKQVAELLGVDVRTVHRLADRKHLPAAMKIEGKTGAWLFSRDVVEMYLRQRDRTAA